MEFTLLKLSLHQIELINHQLPNNLQNVHFHLHHQLFLHLANVKQNDNCNQHDHDVYELKEYIMVYLKFTNHSVPS